MFKICASVNQLESFFFFFFYDDAQPLYLKSCFYHKHNVIIDIKQWVRPGTYLGEARGWATIFYMDNYINLLLINTYVNDSRHTKDRTALFFGRSVVFTDSKRFNAMNEQVQNLSRLLAQIKNARTYAVYVSCFVHLLNLIHQ